MWVPTRSNDGMSLAATFKISLYFLVALSGWILGMAEEGWIPYGSIPAAVIGYLWSESWLSKKPTGPHGMNDLFASGLGLAALLAATNEFFSKSLEGRLMSGTHLVVYLSWIVLLQRKTDRRYWLLMALGVLQVAVASILTGGQTTMWFGLYSLVYVFAAVWTLSVFSLKRAESQFAPGTKPATTSPTRRSVAIGSVKIEDGATWITSAFVTGVFVSSLAGLVVSMLFFLLIPRVWMPVSGPLVDDDTPASANRLRATMATEVRLGSMGSILERMDPVLQVRLHVSRRSMMPAQEYAERIGLAEPLFRGAVLSQYEPPVWKADPESIQRPQRLIPAVRRTLVRQEIRLDDVGTDTMLFLGSPMGLVDAEGQARGNYQWLTNLIYRNPELKNQGSIKYSVYSELPTETLPYNAVTVSEFARAQYLRMGYLQRLKQVPQNLEQLTSLARQIVDRERQQRGTELTGLQSAQAIESYLRDSGEYSYSLEQAVQDAKIDPVEDFLFNRKQGHCEYFASALVLMLRAVDIPARLINGYKGGNYEDDSKTLYVQQRHAHAWCEAWIDQAWVTFDATPADERAASVESVLANQTLWEGFQSTLTSIWSENFVNISYEQQDEAFYGPLRSLSEAALTILKDLWQSPRASLVAFFELLTNPRSWFSMRGAGALLLVGVVAWVTWRVTRFIRQRWRNSCESPEARSLHKRIEFYERFARLMQTHNLQRAESQTQLEFARETASALEPRLQLAGLTCGPGEISDLFYRVRFGDLDLADKEVHHVEELLRGMEQALHPPSLTSLPVAEPKAC